VNDCQLEKTCTCFPKNMYDFFQKHVRVFSGACTAENSNILP
jgi:hypothetical protein